MNATFYGVVNHEAKNIEHFCLRCGATCSIEKEDEELSKVVIINFNTDKIILHTCIGDELILASATNQMTIVIESVNFERLTII